MKYDLSGFQNLNRKALDEVGKAIEDLERLRDKVSEAEATIVRLIESNGLQALFGRAVAPEPVARVKRVGTGEPAKSIVVPDDYKAGLVEFLRSRKEPINVDTIAAEWVGSDGSPRYSKATISQRMPLVAKEGLVRVKADGVKKFYFVD